MAYIVVGGLAHLPALDHGPVVSLVRSRTGDAADQRKAGEKMAESRVTTSNY